MCLWFSLSEEYVYFSHLWSQPCFDLSDNLFTAVCQFQGHQSSHDSAVTRESCRCSMLACKVSCFLRPFSFPVLTSLYWKMRQLAWKPSLDIKLSFVGPLLGPDDSTDQSPACLTLVLVEVHTCLQIQENKVVGMSELCLTGDFSQRESKCNPMPCLKKILDSCSVVTEIKNIQRHLLTDQVTDDK